MALFISPLQLCSVLEKNVLVAAVVLLIAYCCRGAYCLVEVVEGPATVDIAVTAEDVSTIT